MEAKEIESPFDEGILSLPLWEGRAIILVDLDAFFASVEQMDDPSLKGKPVIVGGDPDKHGVVSTCSYEAREYGVRSAMPSSTARRLCPDAVWVAGRHDRYREVSKKVMGIIADETPFMQQVSIDEAFADISPTRVNVEHPVAVAKRIQDKISKLGITCSIGLATTKAIAKIASDMDKPMGLTVVYPGKEREFLSDLPARRLSGIGPKAAERLEDLGIATLGDLADADIGVLEKALGSQAAMFKERAAGSDNESIETSRDVKSVSNELTFANDLTTNQEVITALKSILAKTCRRARKKQLLPDTIAVKVRFSDRSVRSAQDKLPQRTNDEFALQDTLFELANKVISPGFRVRLLGVRLSGFSNEEAIQTTLPIDMLLVDGAYEGDEGGDLNLVDEAFAQKGRPSKPKDDLLKATDALKDKFGEDAIKYGSDLKNEENLTGSSTKNIMQ